MEPGPYSEYYQTTGTFAGIESVETVVGIVPAAHIHVSGCMTEFAGTTNESARFFEEDCWYAENLGKVRETGSEYWTRYYSTNGSRSYTVELTDMLNQ